MKSLRTTDLTFLIIGFIFLVLAFVFQQSSQLPFLVMGVSFIVIGIVSANETKKEGK